MVNDLLDYMEMQSHASKLNSYDTVLIEDVHKLKRLIGMLIDSTGDFISEVYVSPLDILQIRLEEIKEISFYIVYNFNTPAELVHDYKKDYAELLKAYLSDEFSVNIRVKNITFASGWDMKDKYLCLYSKFNLRVYQQLSDNEKFIVKDIIAITERNISICYSSLNCGYKSVIVHANSLTDFTNIEKHIREMNRLYKTQLSNDKDKTKIKYTILVSSLMRELELPYTMITVDDVKDTEVFNENESV